MTPVILETRNLSKEFYKGSSILGKPKSGVKAVTDVNLKIYEGESLGVVGESGCGKSTLARLITGLHMPTEGEILFRGEPVDIEHKRKEYYSEVQFMFQDPLSSLNPRKTVRQILETPMKHILKLSKKEREERVSRLMDLVSLRPEFVSRHPHEFSGGQSQRIGIARALASDPKVILLDEPVSALDVSVQAQIIKLFNELKERLGLTYVFISHDLAVVEKVCDRAVVMYLGRIAEYGSIEDIFSNPKHPYTKILLQSVPKPGVHMSGDAVIQGEPPNPSDPPPGCAFAPRCPMAQDICRESVPELKHISAERKCACFFAEADNE